MQTQTAMFPEPECDTSRDAWRTPRWLFDLLDADYRFAIDLAADDSNHLCDRYLTTREDSLAVEWPRKDWCWLNPPFSRLAEFAAKAAASGSCVLMLCPSGKTEQVWWHESVIGKAEAILYPRQRIAYTPPPGALASSPAFASCLVRYYGDVIHPRGTVIKSLT